MKNRNRLADGSSEERLTASRPQPKLISVVIPAKDEANNLPSLIHKIKTSLSQHRYEIIIVDDGSTDGTIDVCNNNGTRVVSLTGSTGKGAAMRTGAQHSNGELVVFLDGDGAHDPQGIPIMADAILQGKADLIIGSRALPGHRVNASPTIRRLSNNLASFIISVIISLILPVVTLFRYRLRWIRITDCTSGFRAMKKDVWHKLALSSDGFVIETEMIYEAVKNRLTIAEVPISCNWDCRFSHLSVTRDGLKTLKLLIGKLVRDAGRR